MYDPMDTEILSLPIDTGVTIEDYPGKKKVAYLWILCIVRKKEQAYLIVQPGYIKTQEFHKKAKKIINLNGTTSSQNVTSMKGG